MNLLVLNGDFPTFPGRAGHEYLHTTGLARRARRVGLVSMVHTGEMDEGAPALREAGVSLYLWRSPDLDRASRSPAGPRRRRAWRRAGEALYRAMRNWRGHPGDTQIQDLQFRNIAGPLRQALREECWQALIVVQSSCARWLDYVPRPPVSVLVLHDVRALVYERQARAAASLRARWASRREARRYRRFEGEYCRRYDLVITVSPADEAWVRTHYRPTRLATVPIPVDAQYFASMPSLAEVPTRVLFTGMMAHPPNADAAAFFAREVLPRVQAAVPAAEFWIVGRDPPPEIWQLALVPGVVVTGFVQDMRPYIAQAAVVVVPLRFGSGMRNKILEAWAMEKCVVSTRVGAEGLACADEVNILLADDAPGLAGRVIEALRNPGLRDRIRQGGRDLVSTAHAPASLARRYYEVVKSVVDEMRWREAPLRAAIDLRWMRPAMGDAGSRLARSLVNHLLHLDGVNRYTVLVSAEARYEFDGRGRANVRFAATDGPGAAVRNAAHRALRFAHRRLGHHYWRTPDVEALCRGRALEAEVALSMSGYVHPDLASVPNLLMVSEVDDVGGPEVCSPLERDARRNQQAESIRRAHHLCVLSEFTRQLLLERLGVSPDRVTTVRPAADPMFHPGSPARRDEPRVLRKYGLPRGAYVLLTGAASPAANHEVAYRALRVLREGYGLDPLLVFTGGASGGPAGAAGADAGGDLRVRVLGSCPATDLPALYAGARALVLPSLAEGVGLPVLEAMWCECPVVCSNVASLPEVAGPAALLVDPRSPHELAHALHRALTDEALRATLIEGGRHRVREFTGTRFALGVIGALHAARQLRYG